MRYPKWLGALCALGLLCLQTGPAWAAPENGAWWNPNQMGSGFSIEIRGNTLLMVGFLYEDDGRATWHVSVGPMQNATTYQGRLLAFRNGQTLTGAYQAPAAPTDAGAVTVQFTDDSHATLTWPGGTIPIERARYGSGPASFQPKTGLWWNTAEFGRGFFIEVQGDKILVAGAMYDANGKPVWYVSVGAMASPTAYQGDWYQYADGQTLTGSYKPPSAPTKVGTFRLEFSARNRATLTLFDPAALMTSAGGAAASRVANLGGPKSIPMEPALDDDLAYLTPPDFWRGTIKFERLGVAELDHRTFFEGPVAWVKDTYYDPILDGYTYSILAGEIIVTHEGTLNDFCTFKGETKVSLAPGDEILILHKDGRYNGYITRLVFFDTTVTCLGIFDVVTQTEATLELKMHGDLAFGFDSPMTGMSSFTVYGTKFTSIWNFSPVR